MMTVEQAILRGARKNEEQATSDGDRATESATRLLAGSNSVGRFHPGSHHGVANPLSVLFDRFASKKVVPERIPGPLDPIVDQRSTPPTLSIDGSCSLIWCTGVCGRRLAP